MGNGARYYSVRVVCWWLGLFGLLRVPGGERWLTEFAGVQAAAAARVFGPPVRPIHIGVECSGTDVLALCLGAILAFPVAWRRRLSGIAAGTTLILSVNTVRIGSLGLAAGDRDLFHVLHAYVWPGLLLVCAAIYVFWWMRPEAVSPPRPAEQARETPFLTTRFVVLAMASLGLFIAASPAILESRWVHGVGGFVADTAAAVLTWWGMTARSANGVLVLPHAAYLVTQECLATPLLPLFVAAVLAYAPGWRWRVLGLAATVPLFVVLGVARLLVVAVPSELAASPLVLAHAFYQVVLGIVLVAAAALWRRGVARQGWRAAGLGVAGGAIAAWAFAHTPVAAWLASLAAADDAQGAAGFAPLYQAGLYSGVAIAAGTLSQWKRVAVGAGMLLTAQVVFAVALQYMARAGISPGVPGVRGWAVVAPLAVLFVVVWRRGAGPGKPHVGDVVQTRLWDTVGQSFPDLSGAPSTAIYAADERRLLDTYLAPLEGLRLVKTDLWDEARNTRILQWAASRGARVWGIDIAMPTIRQARAAFGPGGLAAAAGDVRALPCRSDGVDAVYSMGTVEHVAETEVAIREVFRVLRSGGRAIIGVPNRHDPFLRAPIVALMQALGVYAYGYEKSYSRRSLRRMVERAGFRVIDETGILFMPGWLRMADLAAHVWCRPLTRVTAALLWPFEQLSRRFAGLRRHGYLLATVVEKPQTARTDAGAAEATMMCPGPTVRTAVRSAPLSATEVARPG